MPASAPPVAPAADRDPSLDRVAVPLDTSHWPTFTAWCRLFGPRVGFLKVGLEAYTRWGPRAVEAAAAAGRGVFLDLKLHDIPNTVAGAVGAASELGVDLLTLHVAGGDAMLRAAADAAAGRLRLLGVTLLTHLTAEELAALDMPGPLGARAASWASLAHQAGCAGVVCSPREAAALRRQHPRPFLLVTPGIRFAGTAVQDQRRTATPAAALAAGADLLVVGRALTAAPDPEAALAALTAELRRGAGSR